MSKYDLPLDLDTDNALSMMIKHIRQGSHVLEFGPAEGRLTCYMHEQLGCCVDIVEIDAESGSRAAVYAEVACLGSKEGDIESGLWLDKLKDSRYDYIIFADVLEHLRNPARVLRQCRALLSESGEVLVSVPNISHNAVIIGLIAGRFQYTPTGLLDTTHLRFFTFDSFCHMAEQAGWHVVEAETVLARLGHMEIPSDYTMVPRAVAKVLRQREHGNVYQYVFRLQRADEGKNPLVQVRNINSWPDYICECYVRTRGQHGWSEGRSLVQGLRGITDGSAFEVSFDLSGFEDIEELRLDPLNTNCVLEIQRLELQYADRTEQIEAPKTNGLPEGTYHIFDTDDPQLLVATRGGSLRQIHLAFKVVAFDERMTGLLQERVCSLQERVCSLQERTMELQHYIERLRQRSFLQTAKDFVNWHILKRHL